MIKVKGITKVDKDELAEVRAGVKCSYPALHIQCDSYHVHVTQPISTATSEAAAVSTPYTPADSLHIHYTSSTSSPSGTSGTSGTIV